MRAIVLPQNFLKVFIFSSLFWLQSSAMASSISLFKLPDDSARFYNLDVKSDASLDFQILLPLKDYMKDKDGQRKAVPPFLLHYNSLVGSGLVGQGWNIEFFSAISRCDHAQTGHGLVVRQAHLSGLCLDGSPLKTFSSGNHSGYVGTSATGERVSVTPIGECGDEPCQFRVINEHGEIKLYGDADQNILNGDASIRSFAGDTLVWSLSTITRDDTKYYLDYAVNSLTRNPKLETVDVIKGIGQSAESNSRLHFYYQDRWDDYSGEIDGLQLSLNEVLTTIQIHEANSGQGEAGRLQALVNFEYSSAIQDKTLVDVESCQWDAHGRSCLSVGISNPLPDRSQAQNFSDYNYLVVNAHCRRKWQLPYQHFFLCDDYFLNAINVKSLYISTGLKFDQVHVEYDFTDDQVRGAGGQDQEDRLQGKERPWQIVTGIKKQSAIYGGSSAQVNIALSWFDADASTRWTGFSKRRAFLTASSYGPGEPDLTMETNWFFAYGLDIPYYTTIWEGLVPGNSTPPGGREKVSLNCQYRFNQVGLVDLARRYQRYSGYSGRSCEKEEGFSHERYLEGENQVVETIMTPENCQIPYQALPFGMLTYDNVVNGTNYGSYGIENLPAQNTCDLLNGYIIPEEQVGPQGKQFPIFRPPGVPAPKEEVETADGEENL